MFLIFLRYELQRARVTWKKAQHLFKGDFFVIKNGVGPRGIYQGQIENLYFLSAVSAVAEHPKRIERLLLTKNLNKSQIYAVALNYCGVWKKVHLDSYFPTDEENKPFCAYSDENELWLMLLEKAYAKMLSGYWNIGHGGSTSEVLKDITGAPSETQRITENVDKNQLWEHLVKCTEKDYIVTTESIGDYRVRNGLSGRHTYT